MNSQRGQALTEFLITAVLFFSVLMGTLMMGRQSSRRFHEKMALQQAAFSEATFSLEERRRWDRNSQTLTETVAAGLRSAPGFRDAHNSEERSGCRAQTATFQVQNSGNPEESEEVSLSTCARDTGDSANLHRDTPGQDLERSDTAESPYAHLGLLHWRNRPQLLRDALRHQFPSLMPFRTGFARPHDANRSGASASFNGDTLMSPRREPFARAMARVAFLSQTAQAAACILESCQVAPTPLCGVASAMEIAGSRLLGAESPNPLCPSVNRTATSAAKWVSRTIQMQSKFVEATESSL